MMYIYLYDAIYKIIQVYKQSACVFIYLNACTYITGTFTYVYTPSKVLTAVHPEIK